MMAEGGWKFILRENIGFLNYSFCRNIGVKEENGFLPFISIQLTLSSCDKRELLDNHAVFYVTGKKEDFLLLSLFCSI